MIPNLRAITAGFFLLLATAASHAVVLNWSAQPAWSGTTNSYDVDGIGGNDITVSDALAGGATFAGGFPVISNFNSTNGLTFRVSTMGTLGTGQVTITIDFTGTYATSGVITSFTLIDVDKDFTGGNFQDRITVTALAANLTTALPVTLTNSGGTSVNTISGSGTNSASALGNSATFTDPQGDVNVSAGSFTNGVGRITIVWDNPDASNRTTQTINLGNISFTPVPEVASSSAALLLCAGLFGFRRRRNPCAAA